MFRLTLHTAFSLAIVLVTASAHRASAQTHTHWLGKSTGTEYVFNTPLPADVAAMLTAGDPKYSGFKDVPKASSEKVNGKSYSLVTTSIGWDNDMIDRGQIAFSRNGGVPQGAFFTMDTSSPAWKGLADAIKAQASPRGTWKFANLLILKESSATPPTVRIPVPELTQLRKKLASFNDGPTKAGAYFPSVQVPANLDQVRQLMLAYGNAGRRDPDFRKNNGAKTVTSLAPATVTTLANKAEKVNKDNPAPPYFKDHVLDAKLNEAAQLQAEYQASIRQQGHTGPARFKDPKTGAVVNLSGLGDRSKHFAGIYNVVEAAGYGALSDFPHAWMSGDTHFRPWFNVDKFYPTIGYGVAKGSDGNWYFAAVPSWSDTPASSPSPAPSPAPTASAAPPPPPATQPASGNGALLRAGTAMVQGRKYPSESGKHYLIFQPDGNLVIYTSGNQFVWGLNTVTPKFNQAKTVTLQPDGNLVVHGPNRAYIWSALNSNPDPTAYLTLTPEGALRLVSGKTGATLWASR